MLFILFVMTKTQNILFCFSSDNSHVRKLDLLKQTIIFYYRIRTRKAFNERGIEWFLSTLTQSQLNYFKHL